ncbi:MAG TPA: hypothetical protein VF407_09015 [Polyangiaceae bacterium]
MKRVLFSLAFVGVHALVVGACAKKEDPTLCAHCHMKIAPTDPFRTTLVRSSGKTSSYDSLVCALGPDYSIDVKSTRVIEYYSGVERDANELVFVQGSDVASPMPDDWVPVDKANAKKFETDHGMTREVGFDQLVATVHGRLK